VNYYVYILTNVNRTTLYVGVTNNLSRRLYEHQHKVVVGFTNKYKLNRLVYFEVVNDVEVAINREKIIKMVARKKGRINY